MPTAKQILKKKVDEVRVQNTNHFATLQKQIDLILTYIKNHT